MAGKPKRPASGVNLQRRAGKLARAEDAQSPSHLETLSPEESRLILHELRVHQIELEMQNEELRQSQVELDAARALYFDLWDMAPVGFCTVNDKGLVLQANLTVATLLGESRDNLLRKPMTRFIFKEDQDIYYQHRKLHFVAGEAQACDLRMVKLDGTPFWAHLAATVAQGPGGAPLLRLAIMRFHPPAAPDADSSSKG